MKQITSNTVLIQGDKSYPAIQTEQGIVWIDKDAEENYSPKCKIIAANFELKGVPEIELEDEVVFISKIKDEANQLTSALGYNIKSIHPDVINVKDSYCRGYVKGYKANQAKYTETDIKKAVAEGIVLWQKRKEQTIGGLYSEILQSINSIKEITVDENFKQI